ncbi:MAG: phosphate regulon sensor histidine kinase PhoR [Gammaproteobacteria bacterium]
MIPRVWYGFLTRLFILGVAGTLIGSLYGKPILGLLAALSVALVWNLIWLYRMHRWVHGQRIQFLPEGSGVWAEVFARVDFFRGRSKRRSKRFKALIKQLRQATRSFPDGGIILGPEYEIITMNKVAEEMLGLKRKKDRGLRIEALLRAPEFIEYLRSKTREEPVEIRSPVNNEQWLSINIVPYGLDQELVIIHDVSQQHLANEMRRDFVANASHELRTPLTVITGYLDAFIEDQGLSEDLRAPVEEMYRQSNRMRTLVEELLRLSQLESEGMAPESGKVNLLAVMKTACQEARALEGCPKTLEVNMDSDVAILGDEKDIQSVVSNLVSNAVRYTPEEGQIVISWDTNDQGGMLTVEDSGTGIAPEHIPRLTERFYRVENGRERIGGEGGTGLGLAIVKHALSRHSATLVIESEPGSGTRFICHFPPERLATVS